MRHITIRAQLRRQLKHLPGSRPLLARLAPYSEAEIYDLALSVMMYYSLRAPPLRLQPQMQGIYQEFRSLIDLSISDDQQDLKFNLKNQKNMKQTFSNIHLTCLTQAGMITAKSCPEGTLTKDGNEVIFTETDHKTTSSRLPKVMKGTLLNMAQKGVGEFKINFRNFNPANDDNPEETKQTICDEYDRAWNIAHSLY